MARISTPLVAVVIIALTATLVTANPVCEECWGKTSGPCRHNGDWSCFDYIAGTKNCPAGTTECGPIDCEVTAWSAWGKCDAECGGGLQSRTRKVSVAPSHGGAKCPVLSETQACNEHKCGASLLC